MRLTDLNGNLVWLNAMRVDSMTTCTVNTEDGPAPGLRIVTPNNTYCTVADFEEMAGQLDNERSRKQ